MGLLSKFIEITKKQLNVFSLGANSRILGFFEQDESYSAITVQRQGSNNSIPVVYGRQKVGGIIVHKYVTDRQGGAKNDTLNLIVAFSEGFIEEIEELFFDDVSENDPKYLDHDDNRQWLNIHRYNGGQIAADPQAVETIPNWTEAHDMKGLAYCFIQLTVDPSHEVWRGEPQITAIIKGNKVYDPRTNSTEFSSNPALCLRDYLTNQTYGKGIPASRIDDSAFVVAANFCDELVEVTETLSASYYDETTNEYVNETPTTTSKQIKRFTTNTILDTGDTVIDNVKALMSSFRCILPPEYIFSPIIEKEENIADTITEDDIISDIDYSSGSISDRYNRVVVKYNAALSNYETEEAYYPSDGDPVYNAWLEEDGNRELEKTFTFNSIDNKAEALQMAEIIAKRSRFSASVSLSMQARGIQYTVGDVVGVNSNTMGWDAKPFRIRDKVLSPEGDVSLSLTEHENSVYPWSNVAYSDRTGGTYLGDPSYVPSPYDFDFVPDITFTTFGRLTWSIEGNQENSFIRGYQVSVYQYVLTNEGGYILGKPAVFSDFTVSKFYDLPIFGLGEFIIQVTTISTLGFISPPADYFAEFKESIKPYEIETTVGDWDIYAKPLVYILDEDGLPVGNPISLGIGATFEFDWVEKSTEPYEPTVKAKGSSITISGRLPDTEYTIYARSFSATGVSDWISKDVTTTATGDQLGEFLDPITQELEDANDKLDGLQQQVDNIEIPESDFEFTYNDLIDQVSDNFWNELTNYERKEDISTETRVRTQEITEVSAEIETVNGNVDATVTRVDEVEALADGTASALAITDVRVSNAEDTITAQSIEINQAQIDIEGNATAVAGVGVRVDNAESDISAQASLISQAQADIDGNAQATNALIARVDDAESDITAQAGLLQDVQVDADNNATAITQIDTRVTNNESGISGNASLIQQVEVKADNNASAVTALQTRVNNAESDITAQADLIQDVELDASNNATAITQLTSRVSTNEDFADAQIILNSGYDSELNELTARAYFGVNVNNRVTGIYVDGSATETNIQFVADKVSFVRPDNNTAAVYWDNTANEYLFDGKIIARDGTFTGTVTASTIQGTTITGGNISGTSITGTTITGGDINGTTITGVSGSFNTVNVDSTGYLAFGEYSQTESRGLLLGEQFDETYVMWVGKGTRNDLNADFYIKRNGTGFIKGSFFQGELISSESASNLTAGNSTSTVTHKSNGNSIKVDGAGNVNFTAVGNYQDQLVGSITVVIKRGSTTINSISAPLYGLLYNSFNNQTAVSGSVSLSALTSTSAGNVNFSATVSIDFTGQTTATVQTYSQVSTFENLIG